MKEQYRKLCAAEPTIPIFSRDWWLDATAGDKNWDVALIEKGGQVIAAMPYMVKKKFGLTLISQPPLTQTLGPWLRPSMAKYANRLGEEKDLMSALMSQLPKFDYFSQNWHYSQTNWLPFYWAGFNQTTRYTYVLPDLVNEKLLWDNFRENIRCDVRKAMSRFKLRVRDDLGIEEFWPLNQQTFSRQGHGMPYSYEFVSQLDSACNMHNCRKIWIAEDADGRYHAGVYVIWDENSAYYLMGGGDPQLRSSGATSLCMWEAIKHAATVTRSFDFEGSMIEPVERFFRAFGAIQMPYFQIAKTPSRLLRTRQCLAALIRGR